MRPLFCMFGLALAALIASSAQANSRGFAWFFAHSKPQGTCSGQHVVATYYHSGRRTASGQAFDPSGYTAAHRTLPFGSRVTLTNPKNGTSVTVVINDRGPFTHGVTLDLTRGAARAIGMSGTQWVCMLWERGGGWSTVVAFQSCAIRSVACRIVAVATFSG